MPFNSLLIVVASLLGLMQASSTFKADPPMVCSACDEWNADIAPFRVFGNTYYVGLAGLSSLLITTDEGLILLDGGLSQSAPRIDTNIRALGFRTEDIRLIVASHEHFDHVGGIAALQGASGAQVAHSEAGAQALGRGEPNANDPQYAFGRALMSFPPVSDVRVVGDGETLRVGSVAITAHLTPGHTPGGTTWTWRSCEGTRCLDVVYADSLNAVSHDSFRFTADAARLQAFRESIAKVAALPCDIVIAVHPGFTDLAGKLKRRAEQPATNPFVDPQGCRTYAADAAKRLDARVAQERQQARVR
jgi:metallo-beta-lactamase class B